MINLIVGSQMSTSSPEWVTCFDHMHKDQVVFLAQVIIAYIVIL